MIASANKILWVGPGMGDLIYLGPWPKVFRFLMSQEDDPLQVSYIKMLDLLGEPKLLFGSRHAENRGVTQEAEQGDFFQVGGHRLDCEVGNYDIIILDFIEAWVLGHTYWPTLPDTPFDMILREWELKLKKLRPYQIWVVHDRDPHSTIIPDLEPEYELVVNSEEVWFGYLPTSRQDITIAEDTSFWTKEAVMPFRYFHVWQQT